MLTPLGSGSSPRMEEALKALLTGAPVLCSAADIEAFERAEGLLAARPSSATAPRQAATSPSAAPASSEHKASGGRSDASVGGGGEGGEKQR